MNGAGGDPLRAAAAMDHPAAQAEADQAVRTWLRRLITVPLFLLLAALLVVALPVLGPAAAVVDVYRRRGWATVRCLAFFAVYLLCEAFGIAASAALWLSGGPWTGRDQRAYLQANFRLQCWWARALFHGAERIFGMRTTVEGDEAVARGPFLLFLRHASVGDTVVPASFISARHGIMLRYVLKQELLWDPCLDIVGNRLPNYFVRRGSGDSSREIAAVQHLLDDLGPRDGVLIYPEGTRFTPAKRAQVLARLAADGDAQLHARAATLRHVLPPRLGGPLGLLAANPGADVVFCAHTGFEGAGTFNDLLNGSLVHQSIRVCFWRVPFADIPRQREAQIDWLYAQWRAIDDWIDRQQASQA